MHDYTIRRTRPDEAAVVIDHRMQMFAEMGWFTWEAMLPQREQSIRVVEQQLADETYVSFFVVQAETIVAGAGVTIYEGMPNALDGTTRRVRLVNVYTEPDHRRRGLARRLVHVVLDWCREQGYTSITLHASDAGLPLYESMGFVVTNEMRLSLK